MAVIDFVKDDIKPNEVKCWSVAIANLNPLSRKSRNAIKFISKLEGVVGVHPHYPEGTLVIFNDKDLAVKGRMDMDREGIITGENICSCGVDKKYMKGGNK